MSKTTRVGRAEVECAACGRTGWWNWPKRRVEHGFRREDWCDLREPMVRVRRTAQTAA